MPGASGRRHETPVTIGEVAQPETVDELLGALLPARHPACAHGKLHIGAHGVLDEHLLGLVDERDRAPEMSSGLIARVATPPRRTSPDVGLMRPHMSFMSVVFPAPLEPTSATFSPGCMARSRPSNTVCGAPLTLRYCTCMSRKATVGSAPSAPEPWAHLLATHHRERSASAT